MAVASLKSTAHTMEHTRRAFLCCTLAALSACSNDNQKQDNDSLSIGLQIPNTLLLARAVNVEALTPVIQINGETVEAERTGDTWQVGARIFSANLSISVIWNEAFEDQVLPLARWSSQSALNSDQTIQLDSTDYDHASFDADNDGVSNLEERRDNTDPFVADTTTALPSAPETFIDTTIELSASAKSGFKPSIAGDYFTVGIVDNPGIVLFERLGNTQFVQRTINAELETASTIGTNPLVARVDANNTIAISSGVVRRDDTSSSETRIFGQSFPADSDAFWETQLFSDDSTGFGESHAFSESNGLLISDRTYSNEFQQQGVVFYYPMSSFDDLIQFPYPFSRVELLEPLVSRQADSNFGKSLSASTELVAIGSASNNGIASGAIHIFDAPDSYRTTLRASDATADDKFADDVSVHGDMILVGAPGASVNNLTDSGAAYLYRADGVGGFQEQKIIPWDATAGAAFGTSVSLFGNRLAIATGFIDIAIADAVYIYRIENDELIPEVKLKARNETLAGFNKVAVGDNLVLISHRNGGLYFHIP